MKRFGLLCFAFSLLPPSTVLADHNVEEVYRYRSEVMEASSNHLEALKHYVEGNLAVTSHVPAHVDALVALSGMYQDLFPAGEQHPESDAKVAIWNDPQGFQQALEYNRQRIMALKQVDPADRTALKRAVNEVRMSCGDCHYYFKER